MSSHRPNHLDWPHQLRRRFRLIISDWDGTSVADRTEPAPLLAQALENLLGQGVSIAIVTGTKFDSVLRQVIQFLPNKARSNLYVFTNRGSEVWSFSGSGDPVLRYRYEATLAQNHALDEIAKQCQQFLALKGVQTQIISDRLNRRKIDLIPVPEWSEPKKSQILELFSAVETRLRQCGFSGGIPAILDLAHDYAERLDLPQARITSDIKHVEVGLTDKSDSVRWIVENILISKGINSEEYSIFGDEFGFIGGVKGSDALMQIPEFENATFASVGREPGGVPDGVINLGGGGPTRFLAFLNYQEELWRAGTSLFEGPHLPTANPSWLIEQEGFDPSREHEMESLFSIGNGYLGVRGSSDLPIPSSQAEFYISGIYDRKIPGFAYSESEFTTDADRPDPFSEIVPFPSPFRFKFQVDGMGLAVGSSTEPAKMYGHERILDLKKGLLFEIFYFENSQGDTISLRSVRAASLVDPHLLLHEIELLLEGKALDIDLEVSPALSDFSLRYPHLHPISEEPGLSAFETSTSHYRGFIATKRALNGVERRDTHFRIRVNSGQPVVLRSIVSIFSNRDEGASLETAKAHLLTKPWEIFDQEVRNHSKKWKQFWDKGDIRFGEKPAVTQANRFGLYQLRSAAPVNEKTSVAARGLTGRSYEGHIFWDAEIFIFPFYLFAVPEAAKNILLYRYRTLEGARKRAASLGYRGACYAWESTVDGADVTPLVIILLQSKKRVPIFTGSQQIHVTADIAYAISRYWEVTGDDVFMRDFGAEILSETARFWASRVSEKDGKFHILGVVGPDEYHHDVNDNAYTNWMARVNLEKSASCLDWLAKCYPDKMRELKNQLKLSEEEIQNWVKIGQALYFPKPNQDGIIEQFAGFFGLAEAKIGKDELLHAPVARLLNWEEVNRLRLIKQADVLMIPFLFPEAWPRELVEKNFRYYAPIADHGSSLSPCVHAAIAARIGLKEEADQYWEESLNLDLQNLMQNTALGIHLGCIGGTWQALVFHFLGLRQKGAHLLRERENNNVQLPLGAHNVLLEGNSEQQEVGSVLASGPAKGAA